MSASSDLALTMVLHHRQQLEYWEQELREAAKLERAPGICRKTGEPHVLVTFHSAAPENRLQCHDCGSCFLVKMDLLTAPHGRSRM